MGAGREEEAREFAARIGSNYPEFVLDDWNMPNLIADVATRAQFVDLMRAAGIP